MNAKRNSCGYFFAFASAVCYGTAAIFIRTAYAHGASAWTTYAVQSLTATAILALGTLKRPDAYRLPLREVGMLCLLGVFGFIGYFCFYLSLQYVVSAIASLLLYTYPLLVNLGAVVIFREKPSPWQVICLLLSTAGIVLTIGIIPSGVGRLPLAGILSGLASSLMTASYNLYSQRALRRIDAWVATSYSQWASTLALLLVRFPQELLRGDIPLMGVAMGALLGTVGSVLPNYLLFRSISLIGASRAALIGISEVPATIVLAFIFLREAIAPVQMLGTALVLGSIALLYLREGAS